MDQNLWDFFSSNNPAGISGLGVGIIMAILAFMVWFVAGPVINPKSKEDRKS